MKASRAFGPKPVKKKYFLGKTNVNKWSRKYTETTVGSIGLCMLF
jgi:hypothetical protein